MEQKRILIVDDNEAIHADFLKAFAFGNHGGNQLVAEMRNSLFDEEIPTKKNYANFPDFLVDSAFQGLDAVQLVKEKLSQQERYSLAFIDMRMPPGIDGITTIEKLWEMDPDLQVVICTAFSDHPFEAVYQKLNGSDNFLIFKKPFDIVEVLQATSTMIKKWELLKHSRECIAQQNEKIKDYLRVKEKLAEHSSKLESLHCELNDIQGQLLHHSQKNSINEDLNAFISKSIEDLNCVREIVTDLKSI